MRNSTASLPGPRKRHTGLAASSTIAEKAKTGGNYQVDFAHRRILIWPVRVS